jgi:hypothetical protein
MDTTGLSAAPEEKKHRALDLRPTGGRLLYRIAMTAMTAMTRPSAYLGHGGHSGHSNGAGRL